MGGGRKKLGEGVGGGGTDSWACASQGRVQPPLKGSSSRNLTPRPLSHGDVEVG